MSARRKGYAKRKGEIPPAARGDAKWRGAAWRLPWQWISGIWFGAQCHGGGQVGERSALMGSVHFSHCSVLLTVEYTLFCLSVNYREMISCIVSTWRIMISCSECKLENL